MLVVAVSIPVLVSVQFGVHMKFLCWIKKRFKSWKIAVDLTELSSLTVSTRTGKKL